jgi:uracil-DNA glycosylase
MCERHDIERCKVWLELERAIVKPAVVVALGGTAARSLLGRAVTITKLRRHALQLPDGTAATDLKLAANVLAQAA